MTYLNKALELRTNSWEIAFSRLSLEFCEIWITISHPRKTPTIFNIYNDDYFDILLEAKNEAACVLEIQSSYIHLVI